MKKRYIIISINLSTQTKAGELRKFDNELCRCHLYLSELFFLSDLHQAFEWIGPIRHERCFNSHPILYRILEGISGPHSPAPRIGKNVFSRFYVCFLAHLSEAQVSYCHSAPSGVRRPASGVRRKLFTFSTSSPERLNRF